MITDNEIFLQFGIYDIYFANVRNKPEFVSFIPKMMGEGGGRDKLFFFK